MYDNYWTSPWLLVTSLIVWPESKGQASKIQISISLQNLVRASRAKLCFSDQEVLVKTELLMFLTYTFVNQCIIFLFHAGTTFSSHSFFTILKVSGKKLSGKN
jgi:hypothetical protein